MLHVAQCPGTTKIKPSSSSSSPRYVTYVIVEERSRGLATVPYNSGYGAITKMINIQLDTNFQLSYLHRTCSETGTDRRRVLYRLGLAGTGTGGRPDRLESGWWIQVALYCLVMTWMAPLITITGM